MRSFVICITALLLVASAPGAFAQDADFVKSPIITAADFQKAIAVSALCEKSRIKQKIPRIDSFAYAGFMQSCLIDGLAGTSLYALVPADAFVIAQNSDRHETLTEANDICQNYVAEGQRRAHAAQQQPHPSKLPNAYMVYGGMLDWSRCVTAEMPR